MNFCTLWPNVPHRPWLLKVMTLMQFLHICIFIFATFFTPLVKKISFCEHFSIFILTKHFRENKSVSVATTTMKTPPIVNERTYTSSFFLRPLEQGAIRVTTRIYASRKRYASVAHIGKYLAGWMHLTYFNIPKGYCVNILRSAITAWFSVTVTSPCLWHNHFWIFPQRKKTRKSLPLLFAFLFRFWFPHDSLVKTPWLTQP